MDEDLQPTAKKIQRAESNHSGAVPLDQPHPEEFSTPASEQTESLAEQPRGQTNPGQKQPESSSRNQRDSSSASYPSFKQIERMPTKPRTLALAIIGALFVIVGVVIMIIGSVIFGIIMALVGLGGIALSMIAPLKA